MGERDSTPWVSLAPDREFLHAEGTLDWPPPSPGRLPRHVVLLADPEGRLAPQDVTAFARGAIENGCCWFEIWGPQAKALEDAVDAVRDAVEQAVPPPEGEEDHVVMTASSTPDEAPLSDAVRMVLCATCSTEGHGERGMSRLFVLASGDDRFVQGLLGWLREPDSIP